MSNFKKQWKIIGDLVSLSIASAKIEKIKIIQKKGVYEKLYPPINLYLFATASSLKSTILNQVAEVTGHEPYKQVTAAILMGSLRKDEGKSLMSPAWICKESVMCLDEFNVDGPSGHSTKQALLDIMEFGKVKRAMAVGVDKPLMIKDKDLYYKVVGAEIEFKTRVSTIIATMRQHSRDIFQQALISRCVPIAYNVDNVDLIFEGNTTLKITKHKVKKNVTIKKKDWETIYMFAKKWIPQDPTLVVRTAGILAKVFAVKGKHDYNMYKIICALKINIGEVMHDY